MRIALAWVDLADPTDRAVALNLGGALKRLGHDVLLVGPRRRRSDPSQGRVGGLPVFRAGTRAPERELTRLHRERAVDLWHCHVFGRDHSPLLKAAKSGRWPMVVTLHLVLEDYLRFAGGKPGLRALFSLARHVTAVSRANLRELRAMAPEIASRSSAVYSYGAGLPGSRARGSGSSRRGRPYLLSVARLAPYKGVDVLLMAFARVLGRHPGLRLVVCGRDKTRGGMARYARALGIEDSVAFAGEVSPVKLSGRLRDCDFVVHPSRRDNLPIALLEAMAAGRTAVASRVGGIPELIRHGKDGLLVPPNDVGALARAIETLLDDPSRRRRLERSAKGRSKRFTWDRAAREYSKLYGKAASHRTLPTTRRSRFKVRDYSEVYSRDEDPWASAGKGTGRRRFHETFALIKGRRFRKALEIGCAGGYFAKRLARVCGRVTGLDLSERAAEAARKRCARLGNARFKAGNFLTVKLKPGFDLVCCLHVFPGFEPPVVERMLARIRGLLAPGGLLLCVVTSRPYGLFRPKRFEAELGRRFKILEKRRFSTAGRSSRYGHLAFLAEAPSPRRKPGSGRTDWIPASAGMTRGTRRNDERSPPE